MRIDKVRIPIQPIADQFERGQLIRIGRIKRLELIPFSSRGCRIIKVIHDFDNVSVVSAMEVQMILGLQLGCWPFVVMIEREWRAIQILST